MKKQQVQPKQLKIKLDENIGEGIYSNIAFTTFNNSEFIIDFGRILPGLNQGKIYSRIVMTPQHAKRLVATLERSVKNFEEKFGELKFSEQPERKEFGFK